MHRSRERRRPFFIGTGTRRVTLRSSALSPRWTSSRRCWRRMGRRTATVPRTSSTRRMSMRAATRTVKWWAFQPRWSTKTWWRWPHPLSKVTHKLSLRTSRARRGTEAMSVPSALSSRRSPSTPSSSRQSSYRNGWKSKTSCDPHSSILLRARWGATVVQECQRSIWRKQRSRLNNGKWRITKRLGKTFPFLSMRNKRFLPTLADQKPSYQLAMKRPFTRQAACTKQTCWVLILIRLRSCIKRSRKSTKAQPSTQRRADRQVTPTTPTQSMLISRRSHLSSVTHSLVRTLTGLPKSTTLQRKPSLFLRSTPSAL